MPPTNSRYPVRLYRQWRRLPNADKIIALQWVTKSYTQNKNAARQSRVGSNVISPTQYMYHVKYSFNASW